MLLESDFFPFNLSTPIGDKVLVLSPHPDDETLGCGGTIRLLIESKKQVKVIFLTSGDKADPANTAANLSRKNVKQWLSAVIPGLTRNPDVVPAKAENHSRKLGFPIKEFGNDEKIRCSINKKAHITEYALLREKEAVKALRILGVSDYEFLRFPDRELNVHYESARDRLLEVVKTYMPDTIYSPSIVELNPDHRTTAALSMEIQRIVTGGRVREGVMHIRLVFYEITTPLRPNILIDITSVYARKKRAIKKYKSQLKIKDYLNLITALNTFRTLTTNSTHFVEAFWFLNEPLKEEDIIKWLSYKEVLNII